LSEAFSNAFSVAHAHGGFLAKLCFKHWSHDEGRLLGCRPVAVCVCVFGRTRWSRVPPPSGEQPELSQGVVAAVGPLLSHLGLQMVAFRFFLCCAVAFRSMRCLMHCAFVGRCMWSEAGDCEACSCFVCRHPFTLCFLCLLLPASHWKPMSEAEGVVQALARQREELSSRCRQVSRRVQAAKRSQKNAFQRARRLWHLSRREINVLLILYGLAEYAPGPAAQYVAMLASKRKWPPKPMHELELLVGDLFLRADVQHFVALVDEQSPADVDAFRVAAAFIREWAVAEWVRDLNQRQGVAPPTEMVLQEFERRRLQYPEGLRPRELGGIDESRVREWARQWRLRWGARHARVRVRGEDLGPAEIREKVPSFLSLSFRGGRLRFGARNPDTFFGATVRCTSSRASGHTCRGFGLGVGRWSLKGGLLFQLVVLLQGDSGLAMVQPCGRESSSWESLVAN